MVAVAVAAAVLFLLSSFRGGATQALKNIYVLKLYGANEVGSQGSPEGFGQANVTLDYTTNSITFNFLLSGLSEPTGAGIYFGDVSQIGLQFLDLMTATTAVQSPQMGYYVVTGAVGSTASTLDALVSSPSSYYIQVTTREYSSGAIRGQLVQPLTGVSITYSDAASSTSSYSQPLMVVP
eukprot:SM000122S25754  [mRNA]  locus=s122:47932:49190:- [translate_table: standard]